MQGLLDVTANGLVAPSARAPFGFNTQAPLGLSAYGDLLIGQNLPERAQLVSQGNSWSAIPLVAQASTTLVAQPTTAFATVLINSDQAGRSYIIERIFGFMVTSIAAAQPQTILAAQIPLGNPITTFTGTVLTNVSVQSLSGKAGAYNGGAVIKGAGAATALPALTAASWFTVGPSIAPSMTTNLGLGFEALCQGRYIVKPGGAFAVNLIGGTAAGTFVLGFEWHEAILPLN